MPKHFVSRIGNSRLGPRCMFAALLILVCAASYHSYFTFSAFRDLGVKFNLAAILNGTAYRPFVYRQLVPAAANWIIGHTPTSVVHRGIAWLSGVQAGDLRPNGPKILPDEQITARYYFVYYSTFVAFVLAIYALYRACWSITGRHLASLIAALIFALLFPLFMTDGGFFYDHWELLFFALSYWIVFQGNPLWLCVLAIPATLNKESYLLFLITLIPAVLARKGWRTTAIAIGAACIVAGALNMIVKAHYAGNPGGVVEWHLGTNIAFFTRIKAYRLFDIYYGLPLPRGFNLINILLLVELVRRSWRELPQALRKSTWVAIIISVPLFILLCNEDELRDFSMLYVTFAAMIACYVHHFLKSGDPDAVPSLSSPALTIPAPATKN